MKRVAAKAYLRHSQQKKAAARQTLAAERAKIKLPYKPDHLTEEELRQGLAKLTAA